MDKEKDGYLTLAAGLIVAAIVVTAMLVMAVVMADTAEHVRYAGTDARIDGLFGLKLILRQ